VQASAPGLGGAAMQLRGMPGRETLVLMDGLPLLGAEPDAFGVLQTPPLDLGQVEVIKGAASALYGASALGGVLNLVSRTPNSESSVLANANSLGGRDVSAFLADQGSGSLGGTVTAGVDTQAREDTDGDGWADLPYYQRDTLRPRLWWNADPDHSLFLTAGFVHEDREGGTMPGDLLPDGIPFEESLRTDRFDVGAVSHWALDGQQALNGRLSLTSNHEDSVFGTERVFRRYCVDRTALGALRASVGGGFSAPTPFLDETQSTSYRALLPLRSLHAERATTASLDAKWADEGWDLNASVFTSAIHDPLEVVPATGDKLELVNGSGPRRVPGTEILIGYAERALEAIASWTYLNATEAPAPDVPRDVPLVPRDTASLDGILESDKLGRIGLELEYTGRQALEDDPYRNVAPGYVELNALAEIRFGEIGVFLNALNLTNVRQSEFDPPLRPTPGLGGDPITPVWAPLVGRLFNVGVRAEL
jgi:outer membrane receptor protein involved in Fe transport